MTKTVEGNPGYNKSDARRDDPNYNGPATSGYANQGRTMTPTVGRIVHYFANLTARDKPQAALITHVHSDTSVNVAVWDSAGAMIAKSSVTMTRGESDKPQTGPYVAWPGMVADKVNPDPLSQAAKMDPARTDQDEYNRQTRNPNDPNYNDPQRTDPNYVDPQRDASVQAATQQNAQNAQRNVPGQPNPADYNNPGVPGHNNPATGRNNLDTPGHSPPHRDAQGNVDSAPHNSPHQNDPGFAAAAPKGSPKHK